MKLKPGMTATISITTAKRTGVLKIANAALRFKPPEPATNQTLVARLLGKGVAGKEAKPVATNRIEVAGSSATNKADATEGAVPPLTGNEPPEELMKRVREMRERGEDPPPEIRAKLRELFQSGVLQRPTGGGPGAGGAGSVRPRSAQPSSRTVYTLTSAAPPGGGDPVPKPEPIRVKTGISDGAYTEILDGLNEGQQVITSVKLPQAQVPTTSPPGASPFGGGGGRRGF